jgi:hypothetical protein
MMKKKGPKGVIESTPEPDKESAYVKYSCEEPWEISKERTGSSVLSDIEKAIKESKKFAKSS